jgi:light-harvesting complex I chlorophyll a/b binding protein 1
MSSRQITLLFALLATAAALRPLTLSTSLSTPKSLTRCAAESEQTIQDLNLDQMFEVFEAADAKVPSSAIPKGLLSSEFNPKESVGSSAPFGFFDPAGFANGVTEAQYKLYQEAEIKHGRVSMLAFLGFVVGEISHILFDGKITGPAIYQFQQADAILPYFWVGVLGVIGLAEAAGIAAAWQPVEDTLKEPTGLAKLKPDHIPGDYNFDPLGLKPKNSKDLKVMKTKELNNGRLAM